MDSSVLYIIIVICLYNLRSKFSVCVPVCVICTELYKADSSINFESVNETLKSDIQITNSYLLAL